MNKKDVMVPANTEPPIENCDYVRIVKMTDECKNYLKNVFMYHGMEGLFRMNVWQVSDAMNDVTIIAGPKAGTAPWFIYNEKKDWFELKGLYITSQYTILDGGTVVQPVTNTPYQFKTYPVPITKLDAEVSIIMNDDYVRSMYRSNYDMQSLEDYWTKLRPLSPEKRKAFREYQALMFQLKELEKRKGSNHD